MADNFVAEAPDEAPPRRRRYGLLTTMVVVVVFAAFSLGLWYAYKVGMRRGSESVAPLIAAAEGPIKVRPKSPGGMQVPYRDTLVYDKLSPGPVKEAETQLLPAPEEPIIKRRPQPMPGASETPAAAPPPASPAETARPGVAAPPTSGPVLSAVPETDTAPGVATPPTSPPPPAAPAASGTADATATAGPAVPPPPEPPPEPTSERAAPATRQPASDVPPSSSSRYRVQLASMRSATAAAQTWDTLVAKHGDVLGSLELVIQKITLDEGRGIYYRVQAGPVATEDDGARICATLRQRKAACIVVRR